MGVISKLFGKKEEEDVTFKNNRDEFMHKCNGWNESDFVAYIENINKDEISTVDLTSSGWGHSFNLTPMKNSQWLYDTYGWCSNPYIKHGDYIKASTAKGIVRLQVMAIDYESDPNDMFFGILVNHGAWVD